MQGKILIVDAIATNRIVLKVKLNTAYYEVVQAGSIAEAAALARTELPDLVVTALDLPDGDAVALCAALERQPATAHVPILATGSQPTDDKRMAALEAGVHDVLSQPIDETLLLGRVRSLIRAHVAASEWQMREDTCRALGLAEPAAGFETKGSCVLVGVDRAELHRIAGKLRPILWTRLTLATVSEVMHQLADEPVPDVFVLVLSGNAEAAREDLRMIAALRASARARHAGVIALQSISDPALGAHALDLGADDLMANGFNAAELALRVKTVMRRKRMGDQLRATVRTGLQAAVFDPLTALYNRRYAMPHLSRIAAHARATGRTFAVMAADLDHFKLINDRYGHASGDAVLVEVAHRLRTVLRNTDMVARIGGEEFMIILPSTSAAEAKEAGQRLCSEISSKPFVVPGSARQIDVTISVGMAVSGVEDPEWSENTSAESAGQAVLARADKALYAAKGRGRNQAALGRPAA